MDNVIVIEGEVSLSSAIEGEMAMTSLVDGEIDKVVFVDTSHPVYDGDYIVTPLVNSEVTLDTNGKLMEDDVTVLRVPYLETANPSGGNTAYIGEHI